MENKKTATGDFIEKNESVKQQKEVKKVKKNKKPNKCSKNSCFFEKGVIE